MTLFREEGRGIYNILSFVVVILFYNEIVKFFYGKWIDRGGFMDSSQIRKLTLVINSVILLLVFGLAGFFFMCKADFLVWFSIPTALVYVLGFVLIANERYKFYVRLVYSWLTFYMSVTTICLGYKFGFHLYCLSMIPINYYTEYLAFKMDRKNINTHFMTGLIIVGYVVSTVYSSIRGPIYETDNLIAGVFWIFNSLVVIIFIVTYSSFLIRGIIDSETRLFEIAHKDRLTGLYNRHYMMEVLSGAESDDKEYCIAMLDIDNFKKVNDAYGHNAGDEVLTRVADSMREICGDCVISRWGGEEFLILVEGTVGGNGQELLERLREKVQKSNIVFEEKEIKVTLTAGLSDKDRNVSLDKWIMSADEKLYSGKHSGKNKVVV